MHLPTATLVAIIIIIVISIINDLINIYHCHRHKHHHHHRHQHYHHRPHLQHPLRPKTIFEPRKLLLGHNELPVFIPLLFCQPVQWNF